MVVPFFFFFLVSVARREEYNVPHGGSRHTVTRNKHIKLYSENRFMLSTNGPVAGYFVSPYVSTRRGVRYMKHLFSPSFSIFLEIVSS